MRNIEIMGISHAARTPPPPPMKNCIITGAAGFIGARMVERCNLRGVSVTSVDDLEAFRMRPEHEGINFGVRISKDAFLDDLFSGKVTRPDAIIHLGACSSTTELDVSFLRKVNLEYSQQLWKYCSSEGVPFIYASSAATYGAGEQGYSDREEQIAQLRPLNPYGESKRLFDLWAVEQESLGFHPPVWSGHKFFNVYGFGERHKGP